MAATSGLSTLSTAAPSDGSASMSSPLALATSANEPNISVWTISTVVTTPTVGRAISQSIAMWPTPRAPISTTAAWVRSGALISVSGTPSSLLNDRTLAAVGSDSWSAARSRSLVVVLPTDPVIPTTAANPGTAPMRRRAWRPSAMRASPVSVTSTAATSTFGPGTGRDERKAEAPRSIAAAMKSWPSRSSMTGTKS